MDGLPSRSPETSTLELEPYAVQRDGCVWFQPYPTIQGRSDSTIVELDGFVYVTGAFIDLPDNTESKPLDVRVNPRTKKAVVEVRHS